MCIKPIMVKNKTIFLCAYILVAYSHFSLQNDKNTDKIETKTENFTLEAALYSSYRQETTTGETTTGNIFSHSQTQEITKTHSNIEDESQKTLPPTTEPVTIFENITSDINETSLGTQEEDNKTSEVTHYSSSLKTTTHENQSIDEVLTNDEYPWWYKDAIKDIAYYLRAHKFNEYDRRYNRNGTNVERTNFQYFPKPPLRSLHWEVHRYCEPSFLQCVDYLRKKLKHVALRRQDDTSIVAQESNWGANSTKMMGQVDMECRRMKKVDYDIAPPFEGPLERYQWRATASYFMCWYTMNEVPDLKHLNEPCDNFAYCLDMSYGPNNEDLRANDSEPFACARYSFCPDPCCPIKHLPRIEFCWRNEKSPCFHENPEGQRECGFTRTQNTDFSDIILNRWNITCNCLQEGYVWSSFYGICVDVDECSTPGLHNCTKVGQACLNLPGSFICVCKWGYYYNENENKCVISDTISQIKLNSKPKEKNEGKRNIWKAFVKIVLKIIGTPSS